MNIDEFVERSLGKWRSQRSAHHLAFHHFEEVTSQIEILPLENDDFMQSKPNRSASCY